MIAEGKDASSADLPNVYNQLRKNGTPAAMMFDAEENHYLVCNKVDEVIDFLNKEMLCESKMQ